MYGQTAYDLIAELYKDDLYNKRDYDEKASLIKKVYEAARLTAQSEVVNYKHDNSSTKRLNAIADGVPVSLVYASLALKSDMDTDNSNGITGIEAEAYINKYAANLTKPQKAQLYSIYAPNNKTNPYE